MKDRKTGYSRLAVLLCSLAFLLVMFSGFACTPEAQNPQGKSGEDTPQVPQGAVRVKVFGEAQTISENGGMEEFSKSCQKLLADVSSLFATTTFALVGCEEFSGASSKALYDSHMESETSYDLRLVVNSHSSNPKSIEGWQGAPYYSIGHSFDRPFTPASMKQLARYMAMSRGAYDISLCSVPSEGNPIVENTPFEVQKCYTWDPLSAKGWNESIRSIIESNGGKGHAVLFEDNLPKGVKVTVKLEESGATADSCTLDFFQVLPGSLTVDRKASYSGAMSIMGFYSFPHNPYIQEGSTDRDKIVANYLVRVTRHKRHFYSWMPVYDAVAAALADKDGIYTNTIIIPDLDYPSGSEDIPDDDYVNRQWEFSQLGGWKFRCYVYAEQQTVKDNGGRIPFMKKVDKLLRDCDGYFSVKGINDAGGNEVHFYMVGMEEFTGQSRQFRYDPSVKDNTEYDFRLVINGHAQDGDVSGGWLDDPYYSLGHDFIYGLWEGQGVDAMAHELGHFRGVPDLYAEKVDADKNPISGQKYDGIRCRMNQCYGDLPFSSYAKALINMSAGHPHCIKHTTFIPDKYSIHIKTSSGSNAAGARFEMYPVEGYSYAVNSSPVAEGTVSSDGKYTFDYCPYWKTSKKKDCYVNMLLKVTFQSHTYYRWMPLHEVEEPTCLSGSDEFTHVITL